MKGELTRAARKRHRPKRRARSLPAAAQAYVALVAVAAVAASLPALSQLRLEPRDLLVFALLCLGAAFGSILIVSTERNHGFNTALVFIAAAVVLLPPALVALMGLAQYWPELVRRRYPVVHPDLQPRELHAQRARGLGRRASRRADDAGAAGGRPRRRSRRRVPRPRRLEPPAAGVCAAPRHAPARCARRASSRGRASRPISCSPLSASPIAGVWEWNPYLVAVTIAPFVLISRSFSLLELLHRSERRFRAIYESTAMGIGLTDTAGRIVDHNRAFGEMLGLPGEELVGRELSEFTAADEASVGDGLFDELVGGRARELRARAALPARRRRGGLGSPDGVGRPRLRRQPRVHRRDGARRQRPQAARGAPVPGAEARRCRPPRRRRRTRLQQPADRHHRAQRLPARQPRPARGRPAGGRGGDRAGGTARRVADAAAARLRAQAGAAAAHRRPELDRRRHEQDAAPPDRRAHRGGHRARLRPRGRAGGSRARSSRCSSTSP